MGKTDYDSYNDQELLKEFLREKSDAVFGEIYNRYNKRIYNYVRKFLCYTQDGLIEDLVNEIFIKVYLKVSTLKDLGKFKSWVYQIAHNLCVNYLSSQSSKKEIGAITEEMQDKRFNIEQNFIDNEIKKCVFNEISKYDDELRQVILLKFYQGMTYNEISEVTNISIRSLKYMMRKALDEINIKLKAEGFL